MIQVRFKSVRPDKVEPLRQWMRELQGRRQEVLQSFQGEGTRHEVAYLIEGRAGPILVYAVECESVERARAAYQGSGLPIDLEHRRVLDEVLGPSVEADLLYECRGR